MEVYLDNSATTKCYESVREIVGKVMCEDYGNPSSMHKKGVDAEKYIKESKETLAKLLKVQEKEIYFTSGGTESGALMPSLLHTLSELMNLQVRNMP